MVFFEEYFSWGVQLPYLGSYRKVSYDIGNAVLARSNKGWLNPGERASESIVKASRGNYGVSLEKKKVKASAQ